MINKDRLLRFFIKRCGHKICTSICGHKMCYSSTARGVKSQESSIPQGMRSRRSHRHYVFSWVCLDFLEIEKRDKWRYIRVFSRFCWDSPCLSEIDDGPSSLRPARSLLKVIIVRYCSPPS